LLGIAEGVTSCVVIATGRTDAHTLASSERNDGIDIEPRLVPLYLHVEFHAVNPTALKLNLHLAKLLHVVDVLTSSG
jgi:hypothetical protein